jgi:hypothetical protein
LRSLSERINAARGAPRCTPLLLTGAGCCSERPYFHSGELLLWFDEPAVARPYQPVEIARKEASAAQSRSDLRPRGDGTRWMLRSANNTVEAAWALSAHVLSGVAQPFAPSTCPPSGDHQARDREPAPSRATAALRDAAASVLQEALTGRNLRSTERYLLRVPEETFRVRWLAA